MRIEFTRALRGLPFEDLKIALAERRENHLFEGLESEQLAVLDKLQADPERIYKQSEFQLLYEMAAKTRKLWRPNQVLKVYFFGGQNSRSTRILDIAAAWSEHCSIKFQATDSISDSQIRISFQSPGSWSYVGTDALGVPRSEATMNFGWLSDDLPDQEYTRVVLHEFGHALGLVHEHQSPAVKMNWNKVYVYWFCFFHFKWDKEMVERNIFQEFDKDSTQHSEIDTSSIMAYQIPPEFTFDRQEFPLNNLLSTMDKQYIGIIYPKTILS